jgi:hypothetical protein
MTQRMTTAEYRQALGQLGLTQSEVGALLGFTDRNSRRYALGETPVPGAVATMIRLWLLRPELVGIVRSLKWGTPDEDAEHEGGDGEDAGSPRREGRAA